MVSELNSFRIDALSVESVFSVLVRSEKNIRSQFYSHALPDESTQGTTYYKIESGLGWSKGIGGCDRHRIC